jgi:citronellyl-CoA dehydrogenase
MQQFQHERFSGIPMGYVSAKDILDMTVGYIKDRVVFGQPLIKKQVLQHRLAEWLMEIECLKQLTYHIVRMKEAGLDATKEITMGKLKTAHLVQDVTAGCMQMHGGMGFMNEMLITRYFRDARVISVGGGADEVMCNVIAKMEGY